MKRTPVTMKDNYITLWYPEETLNIELAEIEAIYKYDGLFSAFITIHTINARHEIKTPKQVGDNLCAWWAERLVTRLNLRPIQLQYGPKPSSSYPPYDNEEFWNEPIDWREQFSMYIEAKVGRFR